MDAPPLILVCTPYQCNPDRMHSLWSNPDGCTPQECNTDLWHTPTGFILSLDGCTTSRYTALAMHLPVDPPPGYALPSNATQNWILHPGMLNPNGCTPSLQLYMDTPHPHHHGSVRPADGTHPTEMCRFMTLLKLKKFLRLNKFGHNGYLVFVINASTVFLVQTKQNYSSSVSFPWNECIEIQFLVL